uniref:Hemicentin-2 n=1 Tax=Cacopsylla melanoneura TaxID=428564 RepID=A0A8D8QDL5_9HEMI
MTRLLKILHLLQLLSMGTLVVTGGDESPRDLSTPTTLPSPSPLFLLHFSPPSPSSDDLLSSSSIQGEGDVPPPFPLIPPPPAASPSGQNYNPSAQSSGQSYAAQSSGNNNYLQELTASGFWSFNDSIDLSKYEQFDHSKFLGQYPSGGVDLTLPSLTTPRPPAPLQSTSAPQNRPPGVQGRNMPVFDNAEVTNITAQLGTTAFLPCRVRNLGERAVSWVRRRDWHILTSGVLTYTNDARFQVIHTDGSDDWNLQIKFLQKRDNGTYECQVSLGQGVISHYYNLHVVVPSATIMGTEEYHIGESSTINLLCIIENSPVPPQYVFWFHNDVMINYDAEGSGGSVTISTEREGSDGALGGRTHSRLHINGARPGDSGNYSCRASNTEPDSIVVFVTKEGDNTAAIHRQETSASQRYIPSIILICYSLLFR